MKTHKIQVNTPRTPRWRVLNSCSSSNAFASRRPLGLSLGCVAGTLSELGRAVDRGVRVPFGSDEPPTVSPGGIDPIVGSDYIGLTISGTVSKLGSRVRRERRQRLARNNETRRTEFAKVGSRIKHRLNQLTRRLNGSSKETRKE